MERLHPPILTRQPIPHSLRIQHPAHPQPVSSVSMQHPRSFRPVEIYLIRIGNHAQLGKVKVRVPALQRIVCPLNLCTPHGHDPPTLPPLHPPPPITPPSSVHHTQHIPH